MDPVESSSSSSSSCEASATEAFQPRSHWAADTPWRRFLLVLRKQLDLQTFTIERDVRRELQGRAGRVLDVGCGNSPFRHLLDPSTTSYQGIDVAEASAFGYANPDVVPFDGNHIPFPDACFDLILCTEVLEHVPEPTALIAEMQRVLKPNGLAIVTLPWSARYHYQPYDFHRYTPPMLQRLFAGWDRVSIRPRGTDLSSIGNKVIVAWFRNLLGLRPRGIPSLWQVPLRAALAVLTSPVLVMGIASGHLGMRWGIGSTDDPLGYTLVLHKEGR